LAQGKTLVSQITSIARVSCINHHLHLFLFVLRNENFLKHG